VKPPTTPRGSKAKPASATGTITTTPGPEANGAPADANATPADASQASGNVGSDQPTTLVTIVHPDLPGADSTAPADQTAVATAPEAPADAGPSDDAEDGAGDAEAGDPGDGTITGIEAAALTIRDFARTEGGEIARDERGRAIVEDRPLRETDIIADRVDGDIVHFVLADGRKISVRK
jgi:hypothetical protein